MSEFALVHFIRPYWLLLLPLAVFLPWLWKRARRPSGDWMAVCDPHLLRWLSVSQASEKSRGGGRWLAGAAILISILALAGPSWQKLPDSSFSARDARMIVLDLSRSMLAQDLRPNRLTRARFRLADLLEMTEEGQVGLVSYAGDAYVVSPLTSDMNTIANLLPALQPDIVPVSGSRADRALEMAASLLGRAGLSHGEILLVTDSANSADAARARELQKHGIITSVLAVGTVDGAPIPSGGGFVSDRSGNVVIARLDRASLQAVADAGGGRYMELGASAVGTSLWLEQDGSEFTRREGALGERWKDAGPWLVLLLLPLALLGFRRGLLFILPLLLLPGLLWPQAAKASWWDDAWQRRISRPTGHCRRMTQKKLRRWRLIRPCPDKPGIAVGSMPMRLRPGHSWMQPMLTTTAAMPWLTWGNTKQPSRLMMKRSLLSLTWKTQWPTVRCSSR